LLDIHAYWNILTIHGPINVKSPNNTSKWQMGFNSAFKGLIISYSSNNPSGKTFPPQCTFQLWTKADACCLSEVVCYYIKRENANALNISIFKRGFRLGLRHYDIRFAEYVPLFLSVWQYKRLMHVAYN
jgi:hypothetical protein